MERRFSKLDRQAMRELATVWKPGVPVDRIPEYIELAKELNKDLETALLSRFDSRGDDSEN